MDKLADLLPVTVPLGDRQYGVQVLVCGAELYTGNTCMLPAAVYEKKATMQQLAKSWIWSWLGNVVGAFAMVAAVSATGMLTGSWSNGIVAMATMKANLPLGQVGCSLLWSHLT